MRLRFQLTRTVSLGALLVSAAITPFGGPAAAEDIDPLYCNVVYAQQAVDDAKVNRQWGCFPANEPRWTTSFRNHYNYCTSGEPDKAFLEFELSDPLFLPAGVRAPDKGNATTRILASAK